MELLSLCSGSARSPDGTCQRSSWAPLLPPAPSTGSPCLLCFARKDILELCTHTPRKSGNTIDLYTTFPWEALCAEVAKLKVQRHDRGQLARLPLAVSAEKENPGSPDGGRGLATSSGSGGNRSR